MKKLILGIACLFVMASIARADLAFTASDVTVAAGSTATLDFFVADPDGSPGNLLGFDFAIDFGDNDSDATPAGLTATGGINNAGLFASALLSAAPPGANYNFQASVFNLPAPIGPGAVLVGPAPQAVFSLQFDVDASVADGTVFLIDLLGPGESAPNDVFSATDGEGNTITGITAGLGSITVTNSTIPEPTSAVVLMVIGSMGLLRRRHSLA